MAVVKYGSIVTEIKGSVGGSTFRTSNGIKTLYNKPNSRTGRGQINGGKPTQMSGIGGLWRDLTSSEQQEWNNLASRINWFDPMIGYYNPTGWQFFLWVMSYRKLIGNNSILSDNFNDTIIQAGTSEPVLRASGILQGNWQSVFNPLWYVFKMREAYTANDNTRGQATKICGVQYVTSPGTFFVNLVSGGWGRPLKAGKHYCLQYYAVNDWGWSSELNFYNVEAII